MIDHGKVDETYVAEILSEQNVPWYIHLLKNFY